MFGSTLYAVFCLYWLVIETFLLTWYIMFSLLLLEDYVYFDMVHYVINMAA